MENMPCLMPVMTDLFKDIHQGAEVDIQLATSPAMILEDEESLLTHLLKGFKGTVKATYAKHMTKFFDYIPGGDPDKIEKL